ncbi:histidine kinase [Pedobacter sp. ISL-68]|uniref:sensor histidine kinase n=1 Tax=unclassified Pedobacter TaxID=2628915 RepID=UPI001BED25D4|nr:MULTISPECIES: histidine kinase [unclassified Pedobacter]MBT2560102.1 histidine kinase [Pedobacter sp. ISL-64]MBT2589081.1 histidine kinase [Pedobacter sp. ISL-68]
MMYTKQNTTKREVFLFSFCLIVMSILYGTPRLFSQGFSRGFLIELIVDCSIMAIACFPIWWLHFRKLAHLPIKRRFALHIFTAFVYYAIWIGLYYVYNQMVGLPIMNGSQVFQNIGPNLLFYIQVFSSLHIDLFFREREAQQTRENELRQLAYRGEINALKAQIQPHFLFNTLNSISASLPREQEHIRVLIARLADTFRYALRSTQQDLVPLSQELDFMRTYLSLEQTRFGKRLHFTIESTPETDHVFIPPMLLQPLVENAIKHGVEPAIEGGTITIKCTSKSDKTCILIENTGRPYAGKLEDLFLGQGVGLKNTAKRLENQFAEPLHVSLNEKGGLVINFCIPF